MRKFRRNDRVKIVLGTHAGRKGAFVDIVPEGCYRVELDGDGYFTSFFSRQLELDEAEMAKAHGQAFRKIAGFM